MRLHKVWQDVSDAIVVASLTTLFIDFKSDVLALYLDSNEISGKIPKQVGSLTSLVDLRLRANKLTGTIPTELGALVNLQVCSYAY